MVGILNLARIGRMTIQVSGIRTDKRTFKALQDGSGPLGSKRWQDVTDSNWWEQIQRLHGRMAKIRRIEDQSTGILTERTPVHGFADTKINFRSTRMEFRIPVSGDAFQGTHPETSRLRTFFELDLFILFLFFSRTFQFGFCCLSCLLVSNVSNMDKEQRLRDKRLQGWLARTGTISIQEYGLGVNDYTFQGTLLLLPHQDIRTSLELDLLYFL
ncbi:hypothetical protein B9Z55_007827 [Caenorhabditis nigoni]|uniref:Uncharacterized protein n=1 Tax=Caenorhabditis nigoni TaxID=1611254 RepID=A0A2G5VBE0_9PELO|nr:hypothetical protein B9Z55_007827 [Caenorhabditis nigoni]